MSVIVLRIRLLHTFSKPLSFLFVLRSNQGELLCEGKGAFTEH